METIVKQSVSRKILGMRLGRFREIAFLRSVIVNVVSIVLIGATVIVLGMTRERAEELKALRSEEFASQSSVDFEVLRAGFARSSESIQALEGAFVDDSGIVRFVQEVEQIRAEGLLVGFSFLSNEPIVDKTKNRAIPFQAEFKGDIISVNAGLSRLEKLPYLIRAESIEISEGEGEFSVIYKGLIYVE